MAAKHRTLFPQNPEIRDAEGNIILEGGSVRKIDAAIALTHLYPEGASYVFNADDDEFATGYTYDHMTWNDVNITKPTRAAVTAEIARIEQTNYQRYRKDEYPEIGDQLDMIYHDMKEGTTTHAAAVEVVKAKHEKP